MINWKKKVSASREDTPNGRYYTVKADRKTLVLPSVTTILQATKPEDPDEKLAKWAFYDDIDCYIRGFTLDTKNYRAKIGTVMHGLIEAELLNMKVEEGKGKIYREGFKHFQDYRPWLRENDIKPILIEKPLYWYGPSGIGFAGTVDMVAYVNGVLCIIDHKTSMKLKLKEWIEDYELQVAAYAKAVHFMYGVKVEAAHINIATSKGFQTFEISYYEMVDNWRKFYGRLKQYDKEKIK